MVSLKVSPTYLEDHSVAAIWRALRFSAGWGAPLPCIATKPFKRSKHNVSSQQPASCCSSGGLKSTAKNIRGAQNPFRRAEQLGWQFLLASGSRRKKGGPSTLKAEGNHILYLKTVLNCCAGRGRGKPYRLRDWSQGICDFYGFLHRNLRDHGAQREDNNAVFSRGIHNSFKFLPTQSTSLVKDVPSTSYTVISVTFPQNYLERQ